MSSLPNNHSGHQRHVAKKHKQEGNHTGIDQQGKSEDLKNGQGKLLSPEMPQAVAR